MSIVQDAVLLMLWKISRYDGIFDGVNCKHDGFFVNYRCDSGNCDDDGLLDSVNFTSWLSIQ